MQNTAFHYLYRDAGNYKSYGRAVFAGKFNDKLKSRLENALSDGQFFIAAQIGVPEVFLWAEKANYDPNDKSSMPSGLSAGNYAINDDDHCWHEFGGLELTSLEPTDLRSIDHFIGDVEGITNTDWEVFNPCDRAPLSVQTRLQHRGN